MSQTSEIPTQDEATLIPSLLDNDESAWRTFHARYGHRLQGAIINVTRRFPQLTGNDHVDEIYGALCLRLLCDDKRRLRSFDPRRGTPLGSWLCALARNSAHDFLRSRRREPWLGKLGDEATTAEPVADAPDAFGVCSSREQARLVSDMIETLSPRDQQFVAMYLDGLTPAEIAERLNISVNTVYSKRHKIQTRLAELMQN